MVWTLGRFSLFFYHTLLLVFKAFFSLVRTFFCKLGKFNSTISSVFKACLGKETNDATNEMLSGESVQYSRKCCTQTVLTMLKCVRALAIPRREQTSGLMPALMASVGRDFLVLFSTIFKHHKQMFVNATRQKDIPIAMSKVEERNP